VRPSFRRRGRLPVPQTNPALKHFFRMTGCFESRVSPVITLHDSAKSGGKPGIHSKALLGAGSPGRSGTCGTSPTGKGPCRKCARTFRSMKPKRLAPREHHRLRRDVHRKASPLKLPVFRNQPISKRSIHKGGVGIEHLQGHRPARRGSCPLDQVRLLDVPVLDTGHAHHELTSAFQETRH